MSKMDQCLLLKDDFLSSDPLWNSKIGIGTGIWTIADGEMLYRKTSLGVKNKAYSCRIYGDRPIGKLDSFTADVRFLEDTGSCGLLYAWNYNGHYYLRLECNKSNPTLDLLKSSNDSTAFHNELCSVSLDAANIHIVPDEWHTLSMETIDKVLHIYMDGSLVMEYDEAQSPEEPHLDGTVGFRVTHGEVAFRNVTVWGTPIEISSNMSASITEPALFYDDFTVEPSQRWLSCGGEWDKNSRGYALAAVTGDESVTWLHGFGKDVICTAVINVGISKPCGILLRCFGKQAYVRAGYDPSKQVWYIEDAVGEERDIHRFIKPADPVPAEGRSFTLRAVLLTDTAKLYVDDQEMISAEGLYNTGFGRTGLYAGDTGFVCESYKLQYNEGGRITPGVLEYTLIPDTYANYIELEHPEGNTILAIYDKDIYVSRDNGDKFTRDDGTYAGINTCGGYSNILPCGYSNVLPLRQGGYIQVLGDGGFIVQTSPDLKIWTDVGQVLPFSDQIAGGRRTAIQHVASLTEVKLENGINRLFLPVAFRRFLGERIVGHFTIVFFSDDLGCTWKKSENDTRNILPGYSEQGFSSWTESKIICCADNTLRMYYSRNDQGCICFTASKDGGLTWEGFFRLENMPCAKASFGICADPLRENRWFMVYVKGNPYIKGSLFPRTHLVLAVTEDGIDWKELMDIDRTMSVDSKYTSETYQFIDPTILVTPSHLHIGYGKSERGDDTFHNQQRAHYVRINRDSLDLPED